MDSSQWSSPANIIQALQLTIMFMGLVVLGAIQLTLVKRNRESSELLGESNSYMNIIDSILELKKWVVRKDNIMNSLRLNKDVVQKLISEGVVKDETDLMERCTFFYHLEKIYYLSKRSPTIVRKSAEGFIQEIAIWLIVPGMDSFFNKFCKVYGTHSKPFIDAIDAYLNPRREIK